MLPTVYLANLLLFPLFGVPALAILRWPRCQSVEYETWQSAKDDPVTGRNGFGPRGFYIFHKDWKKDGDPNSGEVH